MSHLRLPRLAALLILPTMCGFVACMSSSTTGHSHGGEGGEGGTNLFLGTGSSSGPGGPSATSGSLDIQHHCMGDAGAWAQLTTGSMPCKSGEECCVIMDSCLSRSQIVTATNQEEAIETRPSCAEECNDCIARAIEVACIGGSCLGRVVEDAPLSSPLRKDHCGTALEFLEPSGGPTAVKFSCGPGPGP